MQIEGLRMIALAIVFLAGTVLLAIGLTMNHSQGHPPTVIVGGVAITIVSGLLVLAEYIASHMNRD